MHILFLSLCLSVCACACVYVCVSHTLYLCVYTHRSCFKSAVACSSKHSSVAQRRWLHCKQQIKHCKCKYNTCNN